MAGVLIIDMCKRTRRCGRFQPWRQHSLMHPAFAASCKVGKWSME